MPTPRRQFVVRFNWRTSKHVVQVSAADEQDARRIVKNSFPGCNIDSMHPLR